MNYSVVKHRARYCWRGLAVTRWSRST